MGEILKQGQKIALKTQGTSLVVEHFLGGGGQGEVYKVDIGGNSFALKWYFLHAATENQKKILEKLIATGPPNEKFLWPIDIVTSDIIKGFGYIMNLRPKNYKSIVDLMKRRVEPSFRAIGTAGLDLSDSFLQLHYKGMCYRDISFGNVFFDPNSGEILICDNDNVAVDDQDSVIGVLGTPRFMAPEIVKGQVKPSTKTDLFSLAVLLFYMFVMHHPLEGEKEASIKCLDLPAMNKLYGTEPVFIFDPVDTSNTPKRGYHDNAIELWPLYPEFLKGLFTRSFTNGITDPNSGRVRESEWRAAMVRLRDSIIYCTCGLECFYDLDAIKKSGGNPGKCWSCNKELRFPPRIRIGGNIVMLNHDTELFPHHVDGEKMYDFSKPIAKVIQNPKNPSIWGLKNLSQDKWVSTNTENKINDVEPGKAVTLAVGTKINFGKIEGEIAH